MFDSPLTLGKPECWYMNIANKYIDVEFHRWRLKDIVENENNFVIGRYKEDDLTKKTHTHEFIQIYYIINGMLRHNVGNETGCLGKGDIFIIPPNVYHCLEKMDGKGVDFISICFMPQFIDFSPDGTSFINKFVNFLLVEHVIKDELKIKPKIVFTSELQIQVENLVMDMLKEYAQKREGYLFYIKGQLLRFLVLIAREYIKTPYYANNSDKFQAYSEAIVKSIRYVEENFSENLKIDDVARTFLLSRTYFCELFKKYTGKTFNEYMNDLRIAYAKKMLACSQCSITEIAYSSGFNDVTNFCRNFKKQMGLSPSEYRKTL